MEKLQNNGKVLGEYGEIILDMKRALGFRQGLTDFDCAYPVQSATAFHKKLCEMGKLSEALESRFAELMCNTDSAWVDEMIPISAQFPLRLAENTRTK